MNHDKKSFSAFLKSPLYTLEGCKKVFPEPSPDWTTSPTLTLSSQEKNSSTPAIFMTLLWPSLTIPCLPCAENPRAGHSSLGGILPQWRKEAESPLSPFWPCCSWSSPGHDWLSGLQVHLASSWWIFPPQVLLCRAAKSTHPSVCWYWALSGPRGRAL